MKKAQITIYLTLIFSLILSVFLSAFEVARGSHLKLISENAVQTAIHSAFGEYHKILFERYGLIFVDTSYMTEIPDYHKLEERISVYLQYNLQQEEEQRLLFARDWYDVQDYNVSLTNIRLATDDWGSVMKAQAVDYIKQYVGGDWIEEVQSWISVTEEYQINSESFEEYHEDVVQETTGQWQENNLLDEEWYVSAGLPSLDFDSLYLEPMQAGDIGYTAGGVSTKFFNPVGHASYRFNIHGTEVLEDSSFDMLEELYFGEYIIHKLGNYRNVKEDSKLDYQAEYILFGYPQDAVNLLRTEEAIFWIRGAANLYMLLSDQETQEIIKAISQLGALIKVPPELIQAIINVCWAAAESADDTRKLMDGKKVLLLKEPKDFTIELMSLISGYGAIISSMEAESESTGMDIKLSYEDYLRLLLYTVPSAIKTYRCMDMMEADIRLTESNEHFRMDACADAVSFEVGISSGYEYFYSLERRYSYF